MVVVVRGTLAGDAAAAIVSEVAEACPPSEHLSLDLSHVVTVDSDGLGVLRALARRHRAHHGSVRVVGATPHLCELLALVGVRHTTAMETER
jgi:anti-anti-sigma factor